MRYKYLLIPLLIISFIYQGCILVKGKPIQHVNNDSTAIFSTHPSRPFKYGYAYTKDGCENYFRKYVRDYKFNKGDVVADIGAASGWIDAGISVLIDSVTFYIQDIDTIYLNQNQFDKNINYYSKVRGTPQTNKFQFVIGTEQKTNLPDNTFDKIIFNNSFHEIRDPYSILEDVSKKLKPNGQIIIREGFSNKYNTIHLKGCNIKGYQVGTVVEYLKASGFYLTNMSEPENSLSNTLTFEKDMEKSDAYYSKIQMVDMLYICELDKLNEKHITRDSLKVSAIANTLKNNLGEINKFYNSLEDGLNSLGYEWLKKKDYKSAINVFKVNVELYPASANVYDSLGEAYMADKQYQLALKNYSKSIEILPDNLKGKERIRKLKELLRQSK